MLYRPQDKFEIISEKDYPDKILLIEEELDRYAEVGALDTSDGMTLSYAYLKVEGAKGSVVVLHGFSEFYKKFSEMTWYFLNLGYNVFLFDQRGHGLSGREVDSAALGHVDDFEKYADDLSEFIDRVVVPNSDGADVLIYSHSMGSTTALLYLMKNKGRIAKAVLSSPMIKPDTKGMPPFLLRAIVRHDMKKYGSKARFRYAVTFDPNHKFKAGFDASYSRFRHNLEWRIADVRYQNSSSTNGWMNGALSVHRKILDRSSLEGIDCRVLLVNAGKDTVVRRGAQKKAAKLGSFEFVSVKDAKHSIYVSGGEILEKYLGLLKTFFDN